MTFGSYGTGTGQFMYPTGVAVDRDGNIFVADYYGTQVEKFSAAGTYITRWGTYGDHNGQFREPYGLSVDSAGFVYVADKNNDRVQKFANNGNYVMQWGKSGGAPGDLNDPQTAQADRFGFIYVSDKYNNRIQKFTNQGVFVSQWGTLGDDDGEFESPEGLRVDVTGTVIYVADWLNHRIQKFAYSSLAAPAPGGPAGRVTIQSLLPNPARTAFTLRFQGSRGAAEVSIVDVAGRTRLRRTLELADHVPHTATFDTRSLEPGLYFAVVEQQGERDRTRLAVIR
jgi:DNA-binding beta-propeller fold protein YncE